jgi:hypothetical protein
MSKTPGPEHPDYWIYERFQSLAQDMTRAGLAQVQTIEKLREEIQGLQSKIDELLRRAN